jgi:RNA polymerase sigma-70 factor (ECF subfamily)
MAAQPSGVRAADLDAESARWLRSLGASGPERDTATAQLYALLLRIARGQLRRQAGRLPVAGPELDDLAHQAAADALLAITARLDRFRGDSRFTTWAYRFVVFAVSATVAEHGCRPPAVPLQDVDPGRLPAAAGADPAREAESRELAGALRRAIEERLTDRQRRVFTAHVLHGRPLDTLTAELGISRNTLYKTLHDARRKLRTSLVTAGYLPPPVAIEPEPEAAAS